MIAPPEHVAFESVAAPIMIVRGDRVIYANRASLELAGKSLEELLGTTITELISRWVVPGDTAGIHDLHAARLEGRNPTRNFWLRFQKGNGEVVSTGIEITEGPREGESVVLFKQTSPEEAAVRALTDALVAASWNLLHLRDEDAVLAAAADALAERGLRVVILRVVGDSFVHVTLRQDPTAQREVERLAGAQMQRLPLPREQAREFDDCVRERRAIFVQDTHLLVDRFRPPEVARAIKAAMPRRSACAPIFVEGEAYGVLTVQKDELSPMAVGAFELFAHRIGSALENVRHHQRAKAQLDELNHLQHKLVFQERLAALGEAAAVLSHEVRNPVGAILNSVAVLKRRSSEQPELLRIIEEESLRLDRLVRDLLHLARPLQPKMASFDVQTVAERAVATVRGRAPTGDVTFELVTPGGIKAVGDSFLLELALENLLMNAIRVSPPKGKVRLRLAEREGKTEILVEDMGPGISPDVAPRLFQPFFTTHATGTGLGLAVVKKVVEAHGGEVRATASDLGGARFEILLRSA